MAVGGDGWTDERVDALKTLWAEGHSASQIAKKLGGVTRNGVIGKVHRLGLSGRPRRAGGGRPGLSADKLALLKRLWVEDVSAEQIAIELGLRTKKTVAYYANREGLPNRGRPGSTKAETPKPNRWHASRGINPDTKPLSKEPEVRQTGTFPVVLGTASAVIDLHENPGRCGWPIGNPGTADYHYCTNRREAGRHYCADHARASVTNYAPGAWDKSRETWARANSHLPIAQRVLQRLSEGNAA
jgi:GcrA cell cycle regulator